jgi:hypothetical protein
VRDTREQVKEHVAWVTTDKVYVMQMKKMLIHQYEEYTREVKFFMIEVYLMQMEYRLIYLYERYAWQENIIMIGVYVMQMKERFIVKEYKDKERNILQLEDTNLENMVAIEFGEVFTTVVIKMKYNTAEIKKKLTVKEGDINMSEARIARQLH